MHVVPDTYFDIIVEDLIPQANHINATVSNMTNWMNIWAVYHKMSHK